MSHSTLLRTLTEKSKLGFGMHKDILVGEILKLNQYSYIRYIYYNVSGISFAENILELVNIRKEDRIQKPGKDPEYGTKLQSLISSCATFKQKAHNKKRFKLIKNAIYTQKNIRDKKYFSKCRSKAFNEGHSV
jgi:hypothetical protein